MTTPLPQDVTQLLLAWGDGDEAALEKLVPIVEAELHRVARRYLNQERPGHTLQPTALVNEAYLRLMDWKSAGWQNRAHFLGVAANVMRRILVDYARRRRYLKRGGELVRDSLDEEAIVSAAPGADVVALDEALVRLAAIDMRKSRIVELRFFGGLTVEETAELLKISPRTVKREWSLAQAWLYSELSGGNENDT
jgi:RNA polymerase sigma factor (TIGR02999 family)